MKRFSTIAALILIIVSIIVFNFAYAEALPNEFKYTIKLDSITPISNNNVGKAWGFDCRICDVFTEEGTTVNVMATSGDIVDIVATATEHDKTPDIGTKTLNLPVDNIKVGNTPYSIIVSVKENEGKYKGKIATWKFSFTVKKIVVIKTQSISQIPTDIIRNGEDKYTWPDGTKYSGNWENNELQGEGVLVYANGDKYVGNFEANQKSGDGTYLWVNGDGYTGAWSDDTMNGNGTYTFSNGDKYSGNWDSGFMNGQGTYTFITGTKLSGIWVDNQYSSED